MGFINVTAQIEISDRRHAWRDAAGDPFAIVDLGSVTLAVSSAGEARAIAAKFTQAANDIEALPAAVEP